MKSYDELLDSLQLLYDNEKADELYEILHFVAMMMNEIDGNLKATTLCRSFRHDRLKVTVLLGEY